MTLFEGFLSDLHVGDLKRSRLEEGGTGSVNDTLPKKHGNLWFKLERERNCRCHWFRDSLSQNLKQLVAVMLSCGSGATTNSWISI